MRGHSLNGSIALLQSRLQQIRDAYTHNRYMHNLLLDRSNSHLQRCNDLEAEAEEILKAIERLENATQ